MPRPDPNEIREDTIRLAILAIRTKIGVNPSGAMMLLAALRDRLLQIPDVQALPQPWARPRLNVRQLLLEQQEGAGYTLLEDDVIDLVKRAEDRKIAIDVTDFWEQAALKL